MSERLLRESGVNVPDDPDHICKRGGLHDYSHTLEDNPSILIEQCVRCGHVIQFNVVDGRIDNRRYGSTHILWFLQPNNPLYKRYYGEARPVPPKSKYAKMSIKERAAEYAEILAKGMTKKSTFIGTKLTNRD